MLNVVSKRSAELKREKLTLVAESPLNGVLHANKPQYLFTLTPKSNALAPHLNKSHDALSYSIYQ